MKKEISCIIKLLIFVSLLLTFSTSLKADEYSIPSSIRFTIDREESALPIVYYFSPPDTIDGTYPILVLCEGSSSKGDVGSVFFI